MPWFKVDDKLHEHDKTDAAGLEAMGLWTVAGSWSADNLKDGFVPARVVSRWSPRAVRLAGALVAAELWDEAPGGWQFRNWAQFQPTRAEVEANRQRARERMANVRANRQRTSAEPTEKFTEGSPCPVPTRPDPSESLSSLGTPHPAPPPVDDEIRQEAKRRLALAGNVTNPVAWLSAVEAGLRRDGWVRQVTPQSALPTAAEVVAAHAVPDSEVCPPPRRQGLKIEQEAS